MEQLFLVPDVGAIVDICALAIIVIFAFVGAIVGFAKTFFRTFGTVLAIFCAVLLCSTVSNFLESEFGFITSIADKIAGPVENVFGKELLNETVLSVSKKSLSNGGLGFWLVNIILGFKDSLPRDVLVRDVLCPTFAYYITVAISGTILFIIFKIIFFLLGEIISKMHVIKIVGAVDRILGVLLGIIRAIVCIQIILFILSILPFDFVKTLNDYISKSTFVTFINNINLFSAILNSINYGDVVTFVKGAI